MHERTIIYPTILQDMDGNDTCIERGDSISVIVTHGQCVTIFIRRGDMTLTDQEKKKELRLESFNTKLDPDSFISGLKFMFSLLLPEGSIINQLGPTKDASSTTWVFVITMDEESIRAAKALKKSGKE